MTDAVTKLLSDADKLCAAAERANADGDNVAFVALITTAAERAQLARLFEQADDRLAALKAGRLR